MLLSELLNGVETIGDYTDCNVENVCATTKNVTSLDAFVCIVGDNFDSHDIASEILEQGIKTIVVQRDMQIEGQIIVEDTRKAYAIMCKNLYGNASDRLELVATTGTNGKTSISTMLNSMLNLLGRECALISTINAHYKEEDYEIEFTTPEADVLHQLFSKLSEKGADTVCMEASSQGLAQNRLYGCNFKVGVFTNLTQDHLNYHKSMENYYQAKKMLFEQSEMAIINIDDPYGERLCDEIEIPYRTYSLHNENADYYCSELTEDDDYQNIVVTRKEQIVTVDTTSLGRHIAYNVIAVIATLNALGYEMSNIAEVIQQLPTVKGRGEVISGDVPFKVVCDYAHTPDALKNIITALRPSAKNRLITIFGCGGDRDRTKRALMGENACCYSDKVIITSDNPRNESPKAIISDILKGVHNYKNYVVILDRTKAIAYAISNANEGDVIVLAGKGHEQYQVVGDRKLYYDETKIVTHSINKWISNQNKGNLRN